MEQHTDAHDRLAEILKALAHPARLRILSLLAKRGTCICGDLVEAMPLSQATVSQHLKVLRQAGLIQGTIDGPRSCYCIDHEEIGVVRDHIVALFGSIENCCRPKKGDDK
ncbi:MAG: winged helix-turn-helix transcriptional regulator [Hyphomicrobiales bacterium]|nr:winged helix-turn-helix transcriptional regulator [Hyphomicrobiales bacterium]